MGRLKHGRRFCSLGRLGHEVGWKYQDIVAALEAKRKVKGEAFHKGKIFWRTVRGMTPHKTERGKDALKRLQTFEGVPPPYDKKKLMVIPSALKVLRLKHGRRFCSLGRLGHEVGWKYQDIVAALEAKRKVKGEAFHKGKLEVAKARAACMKDAKVAKQIAPFQKVIEGYGHA